MESKITRLILVYGLFAIAMLVAWLWDSIVLEKRNRQRKQTTQVNEY